MEKTWTENKLNCEELGQKLGIPIKSITRGISEETGLSSIKIEFEGEPTAEQLAKLDLLLAANREGGRSLADVVADNIDLTYPNPHREAFKLSQLHGLTQQQLENHIENNVTNLVQAKEFLKKLSAVVLYLVKQTKLDK